MEEKTCNIFVLWFGSAASVICLWHFFYMVKACCKSLGKERRERRELAHRNIDAEVQKRLDEMITHVPKPNFPLNSNKYSSSSHVCHSQSSSSTCNSSALQHTPGPSSSVCSSTYKTIAPTSSTTDTPTKSILSTKSSIGPALSREKSVTFNSGYSERPSVRTKIIEKTAEEETEC